MLVFFILFISIFKKVVGPQSWQIGVQNPATSSFSRRNVVFSSSTDVLLKNKIVIYILLTLFLLLFLGLILIASHFYQEILALQIEKNQLLGNIQELQNQVNLINSLKVQPTVEAIPETPENSRIQGLVFFVGSVVLFVIIRSFLGSTGDTSTPDAIKITDTSCLDSFKEISVNNAAQSAPVLPNVEENQLLQELGQNLLQKIDTVANSNITEFGKILTEVVKNNNHALLESINIFQNHAVKSIKKEIQTSVDLINTKMVNIAKAGAQVFDTHFEDQNKNQLEFEKQLDDVLVLISKSLKKIKNAVMDSESESQADDSQNRDSQPNENQAIADSQDENQSQGEHSSQWTTDSEEDAIDVVESNNNAIESTENISIPDIPAPDIPTIPNAGPQASMDWLLNNSLDVMNFIDFQTIINIIIPPIF